MQFNCKQNQYKTKGYPKAAFLNNNQTIRLFCLFKKLAGYLAEAYAIRCNAKSIERSIALRRRCS